MKVGIMKGLLLAAH